jgi:DNA-binding response OmpR family regulator
MSGGRILIVEDDPELREMYREWLSASYDVAVAVDGSEALERFDDRTDLVLLDRRLPDVDSVILLPLLREQHPDCRIAMLTGVDPDDQVLEMDFDAYATKPVRETELRAFVEGLLGGDGARLVDRDGVYR